MFLNSTVKINKILYQIKTVDNKELNRHQDEDNSVIGLTDCIDQIIYLDKDLKKERMKQTLIHELTHAYINECYPSEIFDEEDLCNFIAIYSEDILTEANRIYKEVKSELQDEEINEN